MSKNTSSKNTAGVLVFLLFVMLFHYGCAQQGVLVTRKGSCNLKIISTEPHSPAMLQAGQKVYVTFRYDMGNYDSVWLFTKPRTNGSVTHGHHRSKSPIYNKYDGATDEIKGYFFFNDPAVVDEIVVRMKDKAANEYVCVALKEVHFEWKGSTTIKASLRNDTWDDELWSLAKKTRDELKDSQEYDNDGALIYRVHSEDGSLDQARTEFHWTGKGRGGYRPDSISENQTEVRFDRNGQPAELHVIHPNYHEFRRPVIFEKGIVIVWDDIVLEPVTPENSCTIKGTVRLEDDADATGISVSGGGASTMTDENGNFTLTGIRSGSVTVAAQKSGYHGLYTKVDATKGQTTSCQLNGYRIRKAKVRWAYQPDGSKVFDNNVVTGTAVLQDNELDRVSFAAGFTQVGGESDFLVYQTKDTLTMRNFDTRHGTGPAILETNIPFEDLKEVPDSFIERCCDYYTLQTGKVYAFRCYDGQHYAKMEVLEIID
jgi:hypothetical protein